MRRRTMASLAAFALALATAVVAELAGSEALLSLSGFLLFLAIILAVGALPFWGGLRRRVPPMPGLFRPPGDGERWCTACGRAAPAAGACTQCGHGAPAPHRKSKETPAEKKRKA